MSATFNIDIFSFAQKSGNYKIKREKDNEKDPNSTFSVSAKVGQMYNRRLLPCRKIIGVPKLENIIKNISEQYRTCLYLQFVHN
jgi:hypothetical protein